MCITKLNEQNFSKDKLCVCTVIDMMHEIVFRYVYLYLPTFSPLKKIFVKLKCIKSHYVILGQSLSDYCNRYSVTYVCGGGHDIIDNIGTIMDM